MLGEELERSPARDRGRPGVVVIALIVHEAVPGRIQEHGNRGMTLSYLLYILERDQMVLFAKVANGWALRFFAHGLTNRTAVGADVRVLDVEVRLG